MNEKEVIEKLYKNRHNLIVDGDIGCGKSTCLMFPFLSRIIKAKENFLIIDSKKEYYNKYANVLKKSGYEISVVNLKNPKQSNYWNPLWTAYQYYQNSNPDLCIEELESLYRTLVDAVEEKAMPIQESVHLLTGFTLVLFKEGAEKEIHLGSLVQMLSTCNRNWLVLQDYLDKLEDDSIIKKYLNPICNTPGPSKDMQLNRALHQMMNLGSKWMLSKMLSKEETIDSKKPRAIFLVPSVVNNDSNILINAYINQLFNQLSVKQSKSPYTMILDDIESIPKIKELEKYLIHGGYYKQRWIIGTRSITTLETIYGDILNHTCDYINVSKTDIDYRIENLQGKIDREWKLEDIEDDNPNYPTLDTKNISLFTWDKLLTKKKEKPKAEQKPVLNQKEISQLIKKIDNNFELLEPESK